MQGGYYANGVLSSFGYHVDDCHGTTEKFIFLAKQGGVNYGLCMEKNERAADEWGREANMVRAYIRSGCIEAARYRTRMLLDVFARSKLRADSS
jgi:hypothetical protein